MMMETAYLAAMAPHQKRPPKLEKLLIPEGEPRGRRRQTKEETMAVMRSIVALMNAPNQRK